MKVLRVGAALDTNGQGFRYSAASERWGDDPDVLKALIIGMYDPADVGGRYREAAKQIGSLSIRSVHRSEAYFDFPRDVRWDRSSQALVQQLADECDVVHLNNSELAYTRLGLGKQRKPALLHHHGTLFRGNPGPLLAVAKRFHMVQAVSTVDLMRPAPELLHWLPTAYDLDMLAGLRETQRRPDDGKVRVVSCPTRRDLKSTAQLEQAVATLQAEGLPVELLLVEGRPWRESLAAKASADIYFDQVAVPEMDYPGGYGCNAIEAWGMRLPVIAGADEWTTAQMRKVWGLGKGKPLPFYAAAQETIVDALRTLVTSAEARAEWGAIGQAHAAKYHAEKPALVRLAELYGLAIAKMRNAPTFDPAQFAMGPGTFRTSLPRLQVRVANQSYRFIDGVLRIDNPQMGQRMRRFAYHQRQHQITEDLEATA